MRLWHKDLISVLPRQQLISQWRECCCIAKNIANNKTPNHILVNKVLDYPLDDFELYANRVTREMEERGYNVTEDAKLRFRENCALARPYFNNMWTWWKEIYADWHNERYFLQCYYNLQEKFDCYGMSHDEWRKIRDLKIEKYGKE